MRAILILSSVLLWHVNEASSQESNKPPCKVECDGSLRKFVEGYATAMLNLDADGVAAAYDRDTPEGKAVAGVMQKGVRLHKKTRVFEQSVNAKFGERGIELLRDYLDWQTAEMPDATKVIKEDLRIYVGEDGASAVMIIGGKWPTDYTQLRYARGKWSVVATEEEVAVTSKRHLAFSILERTIVTPLAEQFDEITTVEELEERLRDLTQKDKGQLLD